MYKWPSWWNLDCTIAHPLLSENCITTDLTGVVSVSGWYAGTRLFVPWNFTGFDVYISIREASKIGEPTLLALWL